MPRIRSIKPEFWTDEKIIRLPYAARLFFIGLWNFADDHGCLQDKPEQLKLLVLPGDEDFNVYQIIDLLVSVDLLELYYDLELETTYLQIKNWYIHQKIDHPSRSRLKKEGAKKVRVPAAVRRKVAEKYGCKPGKGVWSECYYCGARGSIFWFKSERKEDAVGYPATDMEFAHIEPECRDGETTAENIVLACRACNRSMGSKNPFEWLLNFNFGQNISVQRSIHQFSEASRNFESSRAGKDRKGEEGKGEEGSVRGADGPGASQKIETLDPEHYYQHLPKTKAEILKFIEGNSPTFIEPFMDLWNIFATERKLPKISTMNADRRRKFATRRREENFDFIKILTVASQSPFALEGSWFTFDWLIRSESNYLKLLEGNYKQKTQPTNGHTNPAPTVEGARLSAAVAAITANQAAAH